MNPGTQTDPIKQGIGTPSEISEEVLATLTQIGEEVNASLDLDEVLARTAALIKRHIDYEIFGVLLVDENTQTLKHRFSIGYSRELASNLVIPMGQGITGTAAATGHAVRVSDVTKDPRYINAIDTVRSELATLLLLNEVSREMSSILDVEELLRRAGEQVKRVIDYQILSIMLYDEEQKVFRHRLDVKHGQRVQGKLRVAASEGIVGAAATLKEPVLVPDVTVDPR